jgi:hypothetical protein
MPNYQFPGRNELVNPMDGFSIPKSKAHLQKAAQQSLGLTEASKLHTASRKESGHMLEASVFEKQASVRAPSEKPATVAFEPSVHASVHAPSVHASVHAQSEHGASVLSGPKSTAQKMDKYIN